jgi:D-serine deaminase-like pyridoxal phosphate-dependent protein
MDGFYSDTVMRRGDPHPFRPALTVRGRVISASQVGFVVTDVGLKEVAGTAIEPTIVGGAGIGARYSLVGDDLGRIDFADPAQHSAVGSTFEVIPPHCYQTVVLHSLYHCVAGDMLVDIWPIDALKHW